MLLKTSEIKKKKAYNDANYNKYYRKELLIMNHKERLQNIPIINKNPSSEEKIKLQKQWTSMLLTDEEEHELEKELIEDIQNGTVPGYIDKNGKPHTMR